MLTLVSQNLDSVMLSGFVILGQPIFGLVEEEPLKL